MAAPKKNEFWKARTRHGRELIFSSPEILKEACYEYFTWVTKSPLKEQKVFGTGYRATVNKMRPFTLTGLYVFLGINRQTWENYKARKDFLAVIEEMENIIYTQKFDGASAGLLNPLIITRDLGLVDKKDITTDFEKVMKEAADKGELTEEHLQRIAQLVIQHHNANKLGENA